MTDQLSSACPDIPEVLKSVTSKPSPVEHVHAPPVETEDASWLVAMDIARELTGTVHEDGLAQGLATLA